jgi:hypothetical protein
MTTALTPATKTCGNPHCGKTFTQRYGESQTRFAVRRFCCRDCSIETVRLQLHDPVTLKTCENPACGKRFGKKPRESRNEYTVRRYCSRQCSYQCNSGRRALPRKPAPAPEVVRAPGEPWRPTGWSRTPNVHGGRAS